LLRRRASHRAGARLPEHHGAERGSRPRAHGPVEGGCDRDDGDGGRFFLCALCRRQALICSHCDRGQIYCAGDCRRDARKMRRRETARRYQLSRSGRFHHAARSRRYRSRQKIGRRQGSPAAPSHDCLSEVSAAGEETPSDAGSTASRCAPVPVIRDDAPLGRRCQWCGREGSPFVRQDHLRRRRAVRFRPP